MPQAMQINIAIVFGSQEQINDLLTNSQKSIQI